MWPRGAALVPVFVAATALCVRAQSGALLSSANSSSRSGSAVYEAACSTCHGPDGKGQPASHLGFTDVEVPDFTDCSFGSPETAPDWIAIVHRGGRARAFSSRMPSFTDALSETEIERVVEHVRGFCADTSWPRGDLNLPRPFVTEKAFPENEAVITMAISADEPGSVETEFVYEHRIGSRGQYEVIVPFVSQQQATGTWRPGLGDVAVALKYALFHSIASGTIASVGGETKLPTGKESLGIGDGVTVAETFAMISQMLPRDGFLHAHAGLEFPISSDNSNEAFWRVAAGKTFSQNRWGRAWSPMVEFLAARELEGGAAVEWDVLPALQVSLSTRQHILVNVGVRMPLTERESRGRTYLAYLLWDWFDGGLFSGW